MKRLLIGVLLTLFSASANAANWVLSAIIWTGTAFVATAAVIASAPAIAVSGAVSLGFVAGVIAISWDGAGNPMGTTTNYLTVNVDPTQPLVTPSNWQVPPTGKIEPVPPDSKNVKSSRVSAIGLHAATQICGDTQNWLNCDSFPSLASLDAALTTYNGGNAGLHFIDVPASTVTMYLHDWSSFEFQYVLDCDDGYSSGGTLLNPGDGVHCFLTNKDLVKKPVDGQCEVTKINGVFVAGHNDPDCSPTAIQGLGTNKLNVQSANSAVSLSATDVTGLTAVISNYDAATNKTTMVQTQLNGSGSVTSQVTSYLDGLNLGVGGGGTGGTGGTGGANCGDAGQQPCAPGAFYTRSGTLNNSDGAPTGIETTQFDKTAPIVELKKFTDGLSIQLPAHTSQCPTGNFDAFGQSFVLNSHCQLVTDNFALFSGVLHLMWIITGTFIVLRA